MNIVRRYEIILISTFRILIRSDEHCTYIYVLLVQYTRSKLIRFLLEKKELKGIINTNKFLKFKTKLDLVTPL